MSDLAKNNNGSGANGGNKKGTNVGGICGTNGKTKATGLSAAELYRRGRALAFGLAGVRIDGPQGLALLKAAADAGSLDAQGELAEALANGLQGGESERDAGVKVAKKPAEAGNPFALDTLGAAYWDGAGGLRKDEKKAREFFARAFKRFKRMAAKPNPDARALYYLGRYRVDGRGSANGSPNGSRKVAAEAVRLWLRSAELGSAEAATWLGRAYFNGAYGLEKNDAEAVRFFRLAAKRGDAAGTCNLAFAYSVGTGGLERSVAEHRRLSRAAVGLGSAEAAYNLAGSYLFDETDEAGYAAPNYAEALRWFQKAAKLGDVDSALRLGAYYRDGEPNFGIAPNAAEAARWYRVGASATRNKTEAKRWLQRANEIEAEAQRNQKSKAKLTQREKTSFERLVEAREKIERLRVEAEEGKTEAMRELGKAYSHTVFRNINEARYWLRKAAKRGDTEAADILERILTDIENRRDSGGSGSGIGNDVWFRYKGIKGSVLRIKTRR